MSIVSIISAVGNNSSIYPLIVRDCGIENPVKIGMTYNQNLKDSKQMANNALRERCIDEYGTSLVWLGGIPLMDKLGDFFIKNLGFDSKINPKLLEESPSQGLELNIAKFKNLLPKEVADMKKVLNNKSLYRKLVAGKFLLSTLIPVSIMGYFLPKFNFKLTDNIRQKQDAVNPILEKTYQAKKIYEVGNKNDEISFKGISSVLSSLSTVNKMAITDGGLTIGRVVTSRNKYEKMENAFKMSMMMILNFVAPSWIEKGLDILSNKSFGLNTKLDSNLLNDKIFINKIKNNDLVLPNSNYIKYFDSNKGSYVSKLCEKFCDVKFLDNGIRDPRAYVDEEKVDKFLKEVQKFANDAKSSGDIEKYAKKALKVKSTCILANVGISSMLLAVVLPKVTFMLRKAITGSEVEPGLMSK